MRKNLTNLGPEYRRRTALARLPLIHDGLPGRTVWSGNIGELQHVVWAAEVDAGRNLRPDHLAWHLEHQALPAAPRVSHADQVHAPVACRSLE